MPLLSRIKHSIESNFTLVLLAGCAGGLVAPGLPDLPNGTAVLVLALLMFIACYRLDEGGVAAMQWKRVSAFWCLRYVALPGVLWALTRVSLPDYAVGVFLLSVLPAGVSSPAIAHIYGGRVAPGFAIVILTQLTTPFLIPLQFAALSQLDAAAPQVVPAPADLFVTMVWCSFVPMVAYALLRRQQALAGFINGQHRLLSMLLVAFVIALAISKQRAILLSHLDDLAVSLLLSLLCYAVYIAAGWWFRKDAREERVTYAVCSCFNNAALGVSLALLHFPPPIVLFVAASEIAWALLPMLFGLFLRRF